MAPDVPPLPAQWPPPDVFQLAELLTKTHWVIEQLAYDLPRGSATQEQVDTVAEAMEGLTRLLRNHNLETP